MALARSVLSPGKSVHPMKKINGQEIAEVDDCPGYGRIHKGLLDAACDLALRKRGVRESVYWPRRNRASRRKEKEGR